MLIYGQVLSPSICSSFPSVLSYIGKHWLNHSIPNMIIAVYFLYSNMKVDYTVNKLGKKHNVRVKLFYGLALTNTKLHRMFGLVNTSLFYCVRLRSGTWSL